MRQPPRGLVVLRPTLKLVLGPTLRLWLPARGTVDRYLMVVRDVSFPAGAVKVDAVTFLALEKRRVGWAARLFGRPLREGIDLRGHGNGCGSSLSTGRLSHLYGVGAEGHRQKRHQHG